MNKRSRVQGINKGSAEEVMNKGSAVEGINKRTAEQSYQSGINTEEHQ